MLMSSVQSRSLNSMISKSHVRCHSDKALRFIIFFNSVKISFTNAEKKKKNRVWIAPMILSKSHACTCVKKNGNLNHIRANSPFVRLAPCFLSVRTKHSTSSLLTCSARRFESVSFRKLMILKKKTKQRR